MKTKLVVYAPQCLSIEEFMGFKFYRQREYIVVEFDIGDFLAMQMLEPTGSVVLDLIAIGKHLIGFSYVYGFFLYTGDDLPMISYSCDGEVVDTKYMCERVDIPFMDGLMIVNKDT